MLLPRWRTFNPVWHQLQQFQEEMNRVFDHWSDGGRESAQVFPPANVWEDSESVHVEAELAGLDLNDLEIYVTAGNQLTIKGERKQPPVPERGVWHRQERSYGPFVRVLTLPFEVKPDEVDARFENGVLRVKLAKHESAKPRKIAVKGE